MNCEFYQHGSFFCLDGPAKKSGKNPSKMKVCITSRDNDFLRKLISKIAEHPECYWVKLSTTPKDGMFLGRCFFTSKENAGQFWAKYKKHPKLMVTLQDDDFASVYRELAVSWKDKSADALE